MKTTIEAAKELIESLRSQPAPWAVPWPCLHEFIGIVTHPRVFKTPTPLEVCLAAVDTWLAGGNLHLIGERDGYLEKLRHVALSAKVRTEPFSIPGSSSHGVARSTSRPL
jgi:predicted nucleic acid-binding protein